MYLFTKAFWSYSLERILKTFAQVLAAAIIADSFMPTSGDDWSKALVQSGIAALISLLTAITAYSSASGTNSTPLSTMQSNTVIIPQPAQGDSSTPLFVQK